MDGHEMEQVCTVARLTGRVQGVGMRSRILDIAACRPVVGWVANESDGSVVLRVQGLQSDLDDFFVALAANAPTLSRIDAMLLATEAPDQYLTGFRIRRRS